MKLVDPERSWLVLERRLAHETVARHRAALERVRDHMRAELRMQIEPVMATLVEEPIYHFHGMPGFETLRGRETVEAYYRAMFAEGRMDAEFQIERLVVDDSTVLTEGTMVAAVQPQGTADVRSTDTAVTALVRLARTPLLVVWPIAGDGRLIGENIYLGAARYDDVAANDGTKVDEGERCNSA